MLLTNKHMGKMSEANVAEEYSIYMQNVLIMEVEHGINPSAHFQQQDFLSYDEFKDYYILALVGRDNYADNLAQKMQHQSLVEGA
jgi:hypothetical protein